MSQNDNQLVQGNMFYRTADKYCACGLCQCSGAVWCTMCIEGGDKLKNKMGKKHHKARNILTCLNFIRLILIPVKFIYAISIERFEFVVDTTISGVVTFFFFSAVVMIRPKCCIFFIIVELAFTFTGLVYFIILTSSKYAQNNMYGVIAFVGFELILSLFMYKPVLTFSLSEKEVSAPYIPGRLDKEARNRPPPQLQERRRSLQDNNNNIELQMRPTPMPEPQDLKVREKEEKDKTALRFQENNRLQYPAAFDQEDAPPKPVVVRQNSDKKHNSQTCVICFSNPRNCVFLPCGHVSSCHDCALNWKKKKGSHMPCFVCKSEVTDIKLIFFS